MSGEGVYIIRDKIILVTGGTGSFGQAFVREALKCEPKAIRIFSRGEFLQTEMKHEFNDNRLEFIIGDVADKQAVRQAMRGADIVVHAAALKQVPTCEAQPEQAIRTNIEGTLNVVRVAQSNMIKKAIFISSDKAVQPISVYGATKLLAEKIFLEADFSCVRFGNMLGSRGSVIPIFGKQRKLGKLSITHKKMKRYWIELDKAGEFTIKFLDIMEGGEIFIPKMAEFKITEIAKIIAPKATREFTGLRPGERLQEPLFAENEKVEEFKDYYVIRGQNDNR